jgi:hypothetical protein
MNSPLFHVSTTGHVNGLTIWGIKIVTPTTARNTDGIDPGNVVNATITRSWVSDGDDNVAVGGSGTTSPAMNISVTNNRFFAGHGESIGSDTSAGISNILFDSNTSVGNAWAGFGSAGISGVADTNSTGIRIKSANDRGGTVTNIQYSNSCFYDHKTDVQFTPYYSSGDSTSLFPNYSNILMQNLVFATDTSSVGTVELTGEFNTNNGSPVTNLLGITMDNVTFPSGLSSLVNSTSPVETSAVWGTNNNSGGTGQYVNLTVGPGLVSSNFLSLYSALVSNNANHDSLMNNSALAALDAPSCSITYLAPELTGPNGLPQTIGSGSTATLDVILTPAVAGSPFPKGTVQLTDALTNNTFSANFPGTGDTLPVTIPASDLTVGVHTFSVTSYSGDSNYNIPAALQNFGSYVVTVVNLASQTISFGAISTQTVGTPLTLTATATSGLAVSYTSSTTSVCTVSGSVATFLLPGTCTIVASQIGNGTYSAATPVMQSFSVVPLNVTASVSVTGSSGIVYNRGTQTGTETITITNTSNATINGPLQLLLTISNSAVKPGNSTGTYQGNPYWTSSGSLAPGASVNITVTFTYSLGTTFTTAPTVYSGGI